MKQYIKLARIHCFVQVITCSTLFCQNLTFQIVDVTLIIKSTSPKSNKLLTTTNKIPLQVWLKFTHWFRRLSAKLAYFHSFYTMMTLEIMSRSPKSYQRFIVSQ